ncbi:MAG: hypothetical protein IJH34_08905, partial [Romboutsia sp.]|nr:hypothetical protein [Romboutsia sp.]
LLFLKGLYGYTSIYNRYDMKRYLREKEDETKKDKYPTFNTYANIPNAVEIFGYKSFGDDYYLKKCVSPYDMLSYHKDYIDNIIKQLEEKNTEIDIAYVEFDTYKTPPLPWLISASKKNPNVILTLKYTDINKKNETIKCKAGIDYK